MSLMRQEIGEIPRSVARLLDEGADAAAVTAEAIDRARPRWVVIAGRGTSDHAAVYARYLFETCLGLPTGLSAPSVTTVYRAPIDWRGGLVLGVSQSGQSPDIVSVLTQARIGGAVTVAITNDAGSPLAEAAQHVLDCHAGVERSVAATKTYVAELVTIAALIARLRPSSSVGASLGDLPDVLDGCLDAAQGWLDGSGVVQALAGCDRALVLSRGYNLATALEVALKLKETSGLFADGYSTADLEHGPLVLAGHTVPALVFRPDGEMGKRIDGVVARLGAGAISWMVGGREVKGSTADGTPPLSLQLDLPESLTPPALVIPGQLLAEAVARSLGRDPDAPPGLEKVTLTI
ncbi:MAG TPA: SIS domain-containing protein [Euzebya sp.]|nr:SIS domain-containing protein [Euzebya sp.]